MKKDKNNQKDKNRSQLNSRASLSDHSKSRSSNLTAVILIIALILVSFAPTVPSSQVITPRSFIIVTTTIILAMIFTYTSVRRKQIVINKSPVTLPLFLLSLSVLVSSLLNSFPFPQENFLGIAGLLICFSLISIMGSTLIKVKNGKHIITVITAIAAVMSLITVFQAISLVFPAFPAANFFNNFSLGTPLSNFTFILVAIAGSTAMYVKKGRFIRPYNYFFPILILGLLSVFILAFGSIQKNQPLLMSPNLSFQTTINALELKSPGLENTTSDSQTAPFSDKLKIWLIGTGSDSYGDIYNLYKPNWVLQTKQSDFNYSQGFNLPLTLLPTIGIIATFAWTWIALRSCAEFKNQNGENSYLFLMPAVAFIMQLFIPIDPNIIFLEAVLIAFSANYSKGKLLHLDAQIITNPENEELAGGKPQFIAFYAGIIAITGLSIWAGAGLIKNSIGLNYLDKSVNAYKESISNPAHLSDYYKYAEQAAKFAPNLDITQRHLAVAHLEKTLQEIENSDEISQNSIEKAIKHAQKSTQIKSSRANNWSVLGTVYQEIALLTDNSSQAYQLAISAFNQAILLDPFNINHYLNIGGIFYSQGQYAEALIFFQKAIDIRPDLSISHFNMGKVYAQLGQKNQAYQAFQVSLSLLQANDLNYNENVSSLQKEMNALNIDATQIPGSANNLMESIIEK